MSNAIRAFGLASALIVIVVACSVAAAQDRVTVATSVKPNEVRSYKVVVTIKGKMPSRGSAQPMELDARYTLSLRHKYGRREGDGLMPLEVSVTEHKITSSGLTLSVTSTTFPRITYLLKRDWRPSAVFGINGTRYANSIPGINYVNMIVLFYLYGGDTPHAVGDKWNAQVKLPFYKETYNFTNTLKALEQVNSVDAAAVHQTIAWTVGKQAGSPPATVTATAESCFAIADGKLIKSRAQSEVLFTDDTAGESGQEPKTSRANISIDISLVD